VAGLDSARICRAQFARLSCRRAAQKFVLTPGWTILLPFKCLEHPTRLSRVPMPDFDWDVKRPTRARRDEVPALAAIACPQWIRDTMLMQLTCGSVAIVYGQTVRCLRGLRPKGGRDSYRGVGTGTILGVACGDSFPTCLRRGGRDSVYFEPSRVAMR